MKTAIKICGITRIDDANLCEELEVEFIGLNMVQSSPRHITIDKAMRIRATLTRAIPVLVFENENLGKVLTIAKEIDCTHVQFHGSERIEDLATLPLTVIKAYRFVPHATELEHALNHVAFALVDGTKNGQRADIERAALLPESIRSRLFIAGGLNPANVVDVIERVHPFGIDSASGIESSPGIKDEKKLRAFVNTVRSVLPTSL